MTTGLAEGVPSGSIVLQTIAEKNKPLLDTIPTCSHSQSNFTTRAKTPPFGWLGWSWRQWMNGTCCNSSEEATFVSATFLTQSVAIKLHHLTKIKEKYCRFEGRKAGRRMKK